MSNRGDQVVGEIFQRIRDVIAEYDVNYDEYQMAKQWLIDVGEAGEWPLVLDAFIEWAVERQASKDRPGSVGTILGPYYLPGAPVLEAPYELPHRPDEPGQRLVMTGRVTSVDDEPLPGAVVDVWHADAEGFYSGFSEVPEGNLRGKVITDEEGRFQVRTFRPAPYTIPHAGPTGRLIAACGWHPWRPAHLHVQVSADDHELVSTQLYMADSDFIDDDVAHAVKDALIVHPQLRQSSPELGIETPHLRFDYEFQLAPVRAPATVA
jgi:catechol 1,2-dioxygenase